MQVVFGHTGRLGDAAGAVRQRMAAVVHQAAGRRGFQCALLRVQQGVAAVAHQVVAHAADLLADRAAQPGRRRQRRAEADRPAPQGSGQGQAAQHHGDPAFLPQPRDQGQALFAQVEPDGRAGLGLQGSGQHRRMVAVQDGRLHEGVGDAVEHGDGALAHVHAERLGPAAVKDAPGPVFAHDSAGVLQPQIRLKEAALLPWGQRGRDFQAQRCMRRSSDGRDSAWRGVAVRRGVGGGVVLAVVGRLRGVGIVFAVVA